MAAGVGQLAPLKAPLSVCIWISDICNLDCKYCYASPFSNRTIETNRLFDLIDELIDLQVFGVVLAGGEPFLHPAILDIVSRCVDRGVQTGVLTNGTLLSERVIERLSAMVRGKRFILQVSLDAIDPATNDVVRGAGQQVVANIQRAAESGIKMQLATVVTKHNLATAHQVIGRFYPAIKRFHFLNVQRTEKSLRNPDLLLTSEEARSFWLNLRSYAQGFPDDLFLPSLRIMLRAANSEALEPQSDFHRSATFDCRCCSVGLTHINIDADFNVIGCDIAKDFTGMGSVKTRSFAEVWSSPEAHAIRNPAFPPCYRNRSPTGEKLEDYLHDEFLLASCHQWSG